MAYDTIKLKSPSMDRSVITRIEQQCILRSGLHMETGAIIYELYAGELMGSWDSRISVIPKYEDWVAEKGKPARLHACEPYLLVEASIHKAQLGHNVYGGPTDFLQAARDLVALVEQLLDTDMPHADQWTVHRVDVAHVYRMSKTQCKEFFDGIQLMAFPRRQKKASKYNMAVHFPGKTTTVKLYHKGEEFAVHDRKRLGSYFGHLFRHHYGVDPKNPERVERKLQALQRLADRRLRVEVGVLADKFQYDFGKNPSVAEVTDEYLERIHDTEIERLLREGKQGMDTVRTTRAVLTRLQTEYGDTAGTRLFGFWNTLSTLGDDVARLQFSKPTFYRNRKLLEEAGVSWRGTDVVVVANDSPLHDFTPMRVDRRFCCAPARNRPEFYISRDVMRLAA